jgi:predicted ATP-binding protein involved in virulence
MRIRELSLTNYRPFHEQHGFGFSEQFTVIAGVNGKGKTAILEALALLISRLLPQISPSKGGYRHLLASDIYRQEDDLELYMQVNCAGIPLRFGGGYNRDLQFQNFRPLQRQPRRAILAAYGMNEMAEGGNPPIASYYTTDRAGFRRPKSLAQSLASGRAAAYQGALSNRMVNYKDLITRLAAVVRVEETEPISNRAYLGERTIQLIQRAIAQFLEGFNNLRFEAQPFRLVIDKAQVTLDVAQLSDGERSFLAIVCDLCRRLALANPGLENPLEGAGVVLIDEIELHLHPKWQREVVQKLRTTFPNIQFIATTHSPFVIQSLKPGELINLDPEEFGVEYADKSIEDISEEVMGVDLPQKSERYFKMVAAAKEYYSVLQRIPDAPSDQIAPLKERLDEVAKPYRDDAAFVAFLEFQRESKLREHASS